MIAALLLVLPLSLAGAVSPMLMTEQTVLLGAGGRRAANQFALGAALTLLVIVVLLVFAGHLVELPTEPKLSATLDILLGIGLVAIGGAIFYTGRHPVPRRRSKAADAEERKRRSFAGRPESAFPFGVFSMATNFTTLALIVVVAKEIAAADLDTPERIFLIGVVVAICTVPVWTPLAATRMAPKTGQRALDALRRLISDHGRTVVSVLLVAVGAFLVARGIFNF